MRKLVGRFHAQDCEDNVLFQKTQSFFERLGFLKFGQTAVSLLRLSDNIEIFLCTAP